MSTRAVIGLIAAGGLARLLLIGTSLGTTDILFWKMWLGLIQDHGIAGAYAQHSQLNHPPLSLLVLRLLGEISVRMGILVSEPLRVLQVVADFVTLGGLWLIGHRTGRIDPARAALLFFLTPAAIFVSAFHGNTDSLMVALVTLAVLFAVQEERAGWLSGVALAAAIGIKIVPVLLVPFFWSALRGRRTSFTIGFGAGLVAAFAPGIAGGGALFANVFSYSPVGLPWGVMSITTLLDRAGGGSIALIGQAYESIARYLLAALLLALWFRRGRNAVPDQLPALCGLALLILLAVAPGAGVQYLVWPLPFLPFLLGMRGSIVYASISSAHLFVAYTIWSRGFPWFLADATRPAPWGEFYIWSGLVVWLMILGFLSFHLKRSADVSRSARSAAA